MKDAAAYADEHSRNTAELEREAHGTERGGASIPGGRRQAGNSAPAQYSAITQVDYPLFFATGPTDVCETSRVELYQEQVYLVFERTEGIKPLTRGAWERRRRGGVAAWRRANDHLRYLVVAPRGARAV